MQLQKRTQALRLAVIVCLPILLGACETLDSSFVATPINLPQLPSDLRACVAAAPVKITQSAKPLTQSQVEALLIKLRQSELTKYSCGRRLLAFYEDVYKGFNTKGAK